MTDLQLVTLGVGLFCSILWMGGFIFTVREFRRYSRESAEKLVEMEQLERKRRPASLRVVQFEGQAEPKKYMGAGI